MHVRHGKYQNSLENLGTSIINEKRLNAVITAFNISAVYTVIICRQNKQDEVKSGLESVHDF